ncbi:Mbov_0397 family ICE element conjugal transfer ATPase [Candidatus Mycoplasma pogonae]
MLQPRKIKKNKTPLYKNFYAEDSIVAVFLLCIVLIVVFLGVPKDIKYEHYIKLGVGLGLSAIFMPSLFYYPKHGTRGWVIFFRWLSFSLNNKNYKKNQKANNTSLLIPYKKIDNGIVEMKSKHHFGILKINGYNLWTKIHNEREVLLNNLISFFNSIEHKITFVKSDELNSYNQIIFEIETKLSKLQKQYLKNMPKDIELTYQYLLNKKNDFDNLEKIDLIPNYYVVVYGKSKFEVEENIKNITNDLQKANFFPDKLTTEEAFKFIYNIYRPFLKTEIDIENNQIENLENKLQFDDVMFFKNYFKMDDLLYSVQIVGEYGIQIENKWTDTIFNTDSIIFWHLNPIEDEKYNKIIDKTNHDIETAMNLDRRSGFRNKKSILELQAIEETTDLIQISKQKLLDGTIVFLNIATSKEDLKNLENLNSKNCKDEKLKINKLIFRQFKGLAAANFSVLDYLKEETQMVSRNIANGFPFTFENYNDGNDFILGMSNKNPVILDIWKRNRKHINSNLVIFGKSGSGKTTAMMKFILDNKINQKAQVIVIDPQREYQNLAKLPNSTWIDLGTGKTSLNPLEITFSLTEENDKNLLLNNEIIISNQINKFIEWLKIINEKLDDDSVFLITKACIKMYKNFGFYKNINLMNLKSNQFPTISNLVDELANLKFNSEEKEIYNKTKIRLKNWFDITFGNQGIYAKTYNAYTNINLQSDLVIIDTKMLTDNKNSIAQNAAFFQLLNFIQTKINYNFFNNESKKVRTMLVVDEAHYFIDKNNEATLDFLFQTTKTIRKYNGSIFITTQNPSDFTLNENLISKTNGILKNMQYHLFFNLTGDDIQRINELYNPSAKSDSENYIHQHEKDFLINADRGQLLLSSNVGNKIILDMHYNKFEQESLFRENNLNEGV